MYSKNKNIGFTELFNVCVIIKGEYFDLRTFNKSIKIGKYNKTGIIPY